MGDSMFLGTPKRSTKLYDMSDDHYCFPLAQDFNHDRHWLLFKDFALLHFANPAMQNLSDIVNIKQDVFGR